MASLLLYNCIDSAPVVSRATVLIMPHSDPLFVKTIFKPIIKALKMGCPCVFKTFKPKQEPNKIVHNFKTMNMRMHHKMPLSTP